MTMAKWRWALGIGLVAVLLAIVLLAPGVGASGRERQQASLTTQGRDFGGFVYLGHKPDTSAPLAGVVVTLYGSHNAQAWGDQLDRAVTAPDGAYLLNGGPAAYPYYHIVETDPPGLHSADVQAGGGGVAVSLNWFRFADPGPGLWAGNLFWDAPEPKPTPAPTEPPQPTCTPTATPTGSVEPSVDLGLLKEDSPDPVLPGGRITYLLTVVNHGTALAAGVIVHDWLPAQTTLVSNTGNCTLSGGSSNELDCSLAAIQPGESFSFQVVVETGAALCGSIVNRAYVSHEGPWSDSNPGNNYAYQETMVFPCGETAVLVQKRWVAPRPPATTSVLGEVVAFDIQVRNAGSQPLLSVRLEDTFRSQELEFLDASFSPTEVVVGATQGLLVWADLTLPPPAGIGHLLLPGESFLIMVHFRAKGVGTIENCAAVWAQSELGEADHKDCTGLEMVDPRSPLQLNKGVLSPESGVIQMNRDVTFMVELTNRGEQPITQITLRDAYDSELLSFRSAAYQPDSPADDGSLDWNNLTGPQPKGWNAPLMPNDGRGLSITFRAKAATPPGEPTLNCVQAAFRQGDGPGLETAEFCAPIFIAAQAPMGLEVHKILDMPEGSVAHPSDTVRFIFQITNTGNTTITQIDLEDMYDTRCLGVLLSGVPGRDPDDPADDGLLQWTSWLGPRTLQPGESLRAIPAVVFQAKAGPGCDPTLNRLRVFAVDEYGHRLEAVDEEPLRILVEELPTPTATATATATATPPSAIPLYLPLVVRSYGAAASATATPTSVAWTPTATPTATATASAATATATATATIPAGTPAATATATATGQPVLILSADFEDGTLTGWTSNLGTWSNPGGYMQGEYTTGGAWNMHTTSGGDILYEGMLTLESGNAVGLTFRSSADGTSSYDAILDAVDGMFKLSKRTPYTVLDSYSMTVERNHAYHVKVVAKGSTLEGYLEGVKRLEVTDSTYSSGQLGVMLYRSTATYDDLKAWRLP
jgi:uncharacterized repeat protein (TIGR01451 family)